MYAWPTAEIAVMGPEGAVNIIHRREIAEAEDPPTMRAKLTAAYRDRFATLYVAAARGYVLDVIDPRDTRSVVARALANFATKRQSRLRKKHGNTPL